MCREHREACPSSSAAEIGQPGFGEDVPSNVRIDIPVVFSLGKQKCAQHCSEDNHGFAEMKVKFISIALLCVFLWFTYQFCCFFVVLCYHSVLSKLAFPALDLLREHEGKMKWSNIFCLSSSCCQLNLSGTISHFMTHYLTWVSFAPLSVCSAEFSNVFLWVAIHRETGKCAFYKFSYFWSFQTFPPPASLLSACVCESSPGLKVSFIFVDTVSWCAVWAWQQLCTGLVECNYRATTDPQRKL